ncbi:MAG: site-specific DNA-methyltransferase, partial [Lamprobacter sp.]|uniref:site-specific DNA-methyltransferase n=1 Tax=Lamprobacter sp. TaxID=3100796 RepID=UPI002B25F832
MKKLTREDGASPDLVADNIERLRDIFPEVFAEGRIDFDALKQALGEAVDEREERYSFTWHGKRRAKQIAQTPSTGTLRPCPEESVNWETTKNLFIEGDNLEVLKLLQKSYHRKVKMIYIDPPYNTGKEFIYPDKWQDNLDTYLRYTGQVDDEGFKVSANAETSGRYHTNWLNMMYPRLRLARNLLRDDGVIFISIDDGECSNLKKICDEVFGDENFIGNIIWQKKYAKQNDSKGFSVSHDHILLYARSVENWQPNELPRTDAQLKNYKNPDNHPLGPWQSVVYTCNKTSTERPNLYYPIIHPKTGLEVWPEKSRVWGCDKERHQRNVEEGRVWWGESDDKPKPRLKAFLAEVKGGIVPDTLWLREDVGDTQESKRRIMELFDGRPIFDTPKPIRLINRMLQIAMSEREGIILDFFAGSASTADAVVKASAFTPRIVRQHST